jgi:hypothetical protein
MPVKSFITLAQEGLALYKIWQLFNCPKKLCVDALKTLSSSLMSRTNKLECLYLIKTFKLCLIFEA